MPGMDTNQSMLEIYLFETEQLIDRLEQVLVECDELNSLDSGIDEIFRIMHTIKGNSMMMFFEGIANIAHAIEDMFDYLKKSELPIDDYGDIIDLVLSSVDFTKAEIEKIQNGQEADGSSADQVKDIKTYMDSLQFMNKDDNREAVPIIEEDQKYYIAPAGSNSQTTAEDEGPKSWYEVIIYFEEKCEMENVRAFSIAHKLKDLSTQLAHFPKDIVESDSSIDEIINDGFKMYFETEESELTIHEYFETVAFLRDLQIHNIEQEEFVEQMTYFSTGKIVKKPTEVVEREKKEAAKVEQIKEVKKAKTTKKSSKGIGNFISVGVSKIDILMDLVGELVVSESMITNNPKLKEIQLENFEKAVRQHRFTIKELQDVVMSIRMVPLDLTFQKLNRIVRDMSKKTGKEINFEIKGAETEVDKSVIEHIGDPLMHIIRNAMDHGIEPGTEREALEKDPIGSIEIEAKQSGGFVYIVIKDDGRGLDTEKLLAKAEEKGILNKPMEDYLDKEVYSLIFHPGFSTKDAVTEFSGRGVGMDVVMKNIEKVGGIVLVDSELGKGTEITFKIPLTLAIVEGMMMKVGESIFTIPITTIKESFNVNETDVVLDTEGHEMIMIRGTCYPIIRLHEKYDINTEVTKISDGILIMIENEASTVLLFVDAILGEQQVVIKNLSNFLKRVDGVSGCALLGTGKISLILDPSGLVVGF